MSEPYSAFHPLCIVHILYVVLLVQSFLYNGEKTCNLNQPGHSTQQKPIESRLGTYALNPGFCVIFNKLFTFVKNWYLFKKMFSINVFHDMKFRVYLWCSTPMFSLIITCKSCWFDFRLLTFTSRKEPI